MQGLMKTRSPREFGDRALPVQVLMDRKLYSYIATELANRPDVEEGGKYVGYLLSPSDPRLASLGLASDTPAFVVTDFLPSGPKAVRTAVELLPDGEFQEALFRRLERIDPTIEHLGTWHSHHCNGLQTLSAGDLAGYRRTVNRVEYRPDYFLASLVTRLPRGADDIEWIDHFLFVRGEAKYRRISESIRFVDWPTGFETLTGHSLGDRAGELTPHPENRPHDLRDQTAVPWYETATAREVLAEDRRFFAERFKGGVVATRRGQHITITGRLERAAISMTYPRDPAVSQIEVSVRKDDALILEIRCDLRWRRIAVTAALGAAEAL